MKPLDLVVTYSLCAVKNKIPYGKKGKGAHELKTQKARAYPGFLSMKHA